MILLAKRVESTGTPALIVPLERLQDAPPATLRFIRDRMDSERLEFFGDAVLRFVISEYLLERFPDYDEGKLTEIRSDSKNW